MRKIKNLVFSCITIQTLVFAAFPTFAHRRTNTATTAATKEQEKKKTYSTYCFLNTDEALDLKYCDSKIRELVILHFYNSIFGEDFSYNEKNLFFKNHTYDMKVNLTAENFEKLKNFIKDYDDKTFKAKGFDFKKLKEQYAKIIDSETKKLQKINEKLKNIDRSDKSYIEMAKKWLLNSFDEENSKYNVKEMQEKKEDNVEKLIKESFDDENELIKYGKESLEKEIKKNEYFIEYYSKTYKQGVENIKKSDFDEIFNSFTVNKKFIEENKKLEDAENEYVHNDGYMIIRFRDDIRLSSFCKKLYLVFLQNNIYDFVVENSNKIRNFEKNHENLKKYLGKSFDEKNYWWQKFTYFCNNIDISSNYICTKDIKKLLTKEDFFSKASNKVIEKMKKEDFEKFKTDVVKFIKYAIGHVEKEIAEKQEKLKSKDVQNDKQALGVLKNSIKNLQRDIKDLNLSIKGLEDVKFKEFKLAALAIRPTYITIS